MLKCKDFHVADQTGFFDIVRRKYEPIENVLERVNAWISSERITVLEQFSKLIAKRTRLFFGM
jgi:hypothetical protein